MRGSIQVKATQNDKLMKFIGQGVFDELQFVVFDALELLDPFPGQRSQTDPPVITSRTSRMSRTIRASGIRPRNVAPNKVPNRISVKNRLQTIVQLWKSEERAGTDQAADTSKETEY